jgi:YgiT-type zinc finger domain-containing protein
VSIDNSQCEQCFVGRYRKASMPYLCWVGDRKVVVPDTPGFQCDICGDSYHNPGFIRHLHRLIDRSAVSGRHNLAAQRSIARGGTEGGQPIGRSAKS